MTRQEYYSDPVGIFDDLDETLAPDELEDDEKVSNSTTLTLEKVSNSTEKGVK